VAYASGTQYSCPLERLTSTDASRFGGKSAALGELLSAGFRVPPGFALSCSAFDEFMRGAGLQQLADEVAQVPVGDLEATAVASKAIAEAMRDAQLPEAVRAEVAQRYSELAELAGVDSPAVAVRSSAVGEDTAEATFAGQQETLLWIRGVEQVCDAVRACWISLYSPTAASYRAQLGGEASEPSMGVAVQLMVDAAVSGVLFTCNPVSGDPSMVAINASWGLGEAVVGGEVTPDDYLISKITGEVVRERIGCKRVEHVPDTERGGTICVDVAPERREVPCLDAAALGALVEVARAIERHFGSHQDVEWAIADAGSPGECLFVLQSRPVTAAAKRAPDAEPASAISLVMRAFGAGDARKQD
jgi:pyruvate,water dikinase